MAVLLHSPTDLDRVLCNRFYAFWHWGAELGFEREPKGESLGLGIELHEIAEDFLEKGTQPDRLTLAGDMFINALPYLPPPKSGGVEGQRDMTIAGQQYSMKIDYRGPLDKARIPPQSDAWKIWVLDHKTSKNPQKYGMWQKHSEDLGTHKEKKGFLDDTQVLITAMQHIVQTGEPVARLRWLYYKSPTKTPTAAGGGGARKSCASDIILERNEVLDSFGQLVHPRAELVARLHDEKKHPLSLDPNPGRCNAFNRECHYTKVCNLNLATKLTALRPKTRTTTQETTPMSGLLARTRQTMAAAANGASTPAPATAPAKEDKINPPEAKAATAPASTPAVEKSANVDKATSQRSTTSSAFDRGVIAVFADRFGDALKLIAADLRK